MRYIYHSFYIIILLMTVASCKEEEVQPFTAERGVNFVTYTNGYYNDNPTDLITEYNFYSFYITKGLSIDSLPLQLGVELEGQLSESPIRIRLTAGKDSLFELADLVMPGDSVIAPGHYRRTMTVQCKKPGVYNHTYKAIIGFDYANSDVVAGTKERQKYTVTVTDSTIWSDMDVSGEDEWNQKYASILGKYGPVKVRFIMATLGKEGQSYNQIKYLYYYTTNYPSYGFASVIDDLRQALADYNKNNAVLKEPDGTIVTFN